MSTTMLSSIKYILSPSSIVFYCLCYPKTGCKLLLEFFSNVKEEERRKLKSPVLSMIYRVSFLYLTGEGCWTSGNGGLLLADRHDFYYTSVSALAF